MKWAENVSKNFAFCSQIKLPVRPRTADIMLSGITKILISVKLQSLEICLFHTEHGLYKVNTSAIFGKLLEDFKNIFQTKQRFLKRIRKHCVSYMRQNKCNNHYCSTDALSVNQTVILKQGSGAMQHSLCQALCFPVTMSLNIELGQRNRSNGMRDNVYLLDL